MHMYLMLGAQAEWVVDFTFTVGTCQFCALQEDGEHWQGSTEALFWHLVAHRLAGQDGVSDSVLADIEMAVDVARRNEGYEEEEEDGVLSIPGRGCLRV